MPARPAQKIPFAFVLDELASLAPHTKPMFGCVAVYAGERILLILRDKDSYPEDNGVWLATSREHHASLQKDFPSMRSIGFLGEKGPTNWQNLPARADDFESSALRACEFALRGDPRIGKVPERAKRKFAKKKKVPSKRASKPR